MDTKSCQEPSLESTDEFPRPRLNTALFGLSASNSIRTPVKSGAILPEVPGRFLFYFKFYSYLYCVNFCLHAQSLPSYLSKSWK